MTTRRRHTAVMSVAAFALALIAPDVVGQSSTALVAVSTGDALLPLARFDGARWINTWPVPEDMDTPVPALANVPQSWLGMRVPRAWTVWFTTGGTARVRVVKTAREGGCLVSPGLVLGETPTAPESLFDKVHVGLATAGRDVPVEAIRRVTDADPEWNGVASILADAHAAQRQQTEDAPLREHPDQSRIRALFDAARPSITWLFASAREAHPTAYAFEFAKHVTLDGSPIHVTLTGWLVRGADGRLTVHDTGTHYEQDPEGTDVPLRVPLGIVRTAAGAVWVVENHPGEITEFDFVAVAAASVRKVLTVDAGGC